VSSWPLASLGDVFEIARGGSPRPIDAYVTDDPHGVNWITIGDASGSSKYITRTRRRIRVEGVPRSRMVNPGDLLLTNSMSFGRPYIMATSGCIHDGWLLLSRRNDDIDPAFFYYLLGSKGVYSEFERLAAGATVKNLNIDLVKGVRVPLPPLPEQRRIAEVLDRAESLRAKRRASLAQLDTLTRSIFFDTHRRGHLASRDVALADLAESSRGSFVNGPFGSDLLTSELQESGVPVVYIRDIREGEYRRVSRVCVTEAKASDLAVCAVRPGDVLVSKVGDPPGVSAVYPRDEPAAVVTQDVIRIRVAKDLAVAEYVVGWLNSSIGRHRVASVTMEATRARFSLGDFKHLRIDVPPLRLQQEYAIRAASVEALKSAYRVSLAQLDALFASLQESAFRGEL
jgi:type I restriction enzyme S subunit